MATQDKGRLTPRQIVRLGSAISADNMESIAEGYLGINDETIKNIKRDASNSEAFNRDIVKHWMCKNPDNQVQKLTELLYDAATECGYPDPRKVEEILRISRKEVRSSTTLQPSPTADMTEDDLMALAEDLKPVMKERMKIDLAPWAKAYIEEDMDKLYTELTIEKKEGLLTGSSSIKEYHELFTDNQNQGERQTKKRKLAVRKKIGKKILCKGDPGMGKTTWGKKIGWDWATGIFKTYSIVFFVFLKLVRPGMPIENVIINQTPKLEGMNMKPEKLRSILDTFGDRCLLILDGLDEHALGKNEDVLKIIEGRKFLYCSTIVTSRPHSTKGIEQHFSAIVRVQGFTRHRAKEFALRLLEDADKVNTMMNFDLFRFDRINSCPIILLVVCVLVRENQINLKNKAFTRGELYFKLTRFLYQKYARSNNVDFDSESFVHVLTKIGKLAWESLKSGNAFFMRSQIIEELGEDAFQYGLLIGHEDCRLICQEIADVVLTFAHRTFQDFLGSFYFVSVLSKGEKLENLVNMEDRKTIRFMVDSLFLHFCLWFVFSDQKYLPFPNRERALDSIFAYVLEKLNMTQLDLGIIGEFFPALRFTLATDPLVLEFLAKVLKHLTKTKDLVLNVNNPIELILSVMTSKEKPLSSITKGEDCLNMFKYLTESRFSLIESVDRDGDFEVVLKGSTCNSITLDEILTYCRLCNIYPSLYLIFHSLNLSEFFSEQVKKIFLVNEGLTALKCLREIPPCPNLTHLCFIDHVLGLDASLIGRIDDAVKKGNLPSLTHLSFKNCGKHFCKSLFQLLQSPMPALTYLNLSGFCLESCESQVMESAPNRKPSPNLQTLIVPAHCVTGGCPIKSLFMKYLSNLKRLFIDYIRQEHEGEFLFVLEKGKFSDLNALGLSLTEYRSTVIGLGVISQFIPKLESLTLNYFCITLERSAKYAFLPQLSKIDLSHSRGLKGKLYLLLSHVFSKLETVILRDCGLIAEDLRSLAYANATGGLPMLKHLNVSLNPECAGKVECLFESACRWNQLLSLNIEQQYLNEESEEIPLFSQDPEVIMSKVESGYLKSLEEFSFTVYTTQYFSTTTSMRWQHLKKINIFASLSDPFSWGNLYSVGARVEDTADHPVLQPLYDMVRRNLLPALQDIFVFVRFILLGRALVATDKYFFSKNDICLNIIETEFNR